MPLQQGRPPPLLLDANCHNVRLGSAPELPFKLTACRGRLSYAASSGGGCVAAACQDGQQALVGLRGGTRWGKRAGHREWGVWFVKRKGVLIGCLGPTGQLFVRLQVVNMCGALCMAVDFLCNMACACQTERASPLAINPPVAETIPSSPSALRHPGERCEASGLPSGPVYSHPRHR